MHSRTFGAKIYTMGMDRNTLMGFMLIGGLLLAMFYFNSKDRLAYEGEQKRLADSMLLVKKVAEKKQAALRKDTAIVTQDSIQQPVRGFRIKSVEETSQTLENNLMLVEIASRGGRVKSVQLKAHKQFDGKMVMMNQGEGNQFSYRINTGENQSQEIRDLDFTFLPIEKAADGAQVLVLEANDSMGRVVRHRYRLMPDGYQLDMQLEFSEVSKLFSGQDLALNWQLDVKPIEKDAKYELTQTHIGYMDQDGFDFEYAGTGDQKAMSSAKWLALKQQFFLTALLPTTAFKSMQTNWQVPSADSTMPYLTRMQSTAFAALPATSGAASIPMQWYFGPSDYNLLKKMNVGLEQIVPYGNGIFAFVKYINRYFLLPVFDYIQHHVANMGLVILLITLLIRLITSPILYKSYLSGAKMKVLKPEVDALREKYKDDQQTFGMEQMKLWKSAGVNPLGGCLPALLQIPIFMSLYYFFQANVDLRGKGFWWSDDLSQYDSVLSIPFSIPFYGDHVSMFTITAVVTSLLISLYSMSNMQDNSNPLMKYMPYIFPVLLLGVFNNLPAALTWYYTVSNTITLLLQFIIQRFIINHDKIIAEIAENRKKPVKKSKMQERIEAMQESQRKLQDMKNKRS
jgi:YidC/Oxa1 family membrane protein insertase